MTVIEEEIFSDCESLISLNLPKSVTSIESSVFYDCSSLTSVDLPEGVTSIGSDAFSGCYHLNELVVLRNVTNIGSYAFNSGTTLWCYQNSYAEFYAKDNGFSYNDYSRYEKYLLIDKLECYDNRITLS